MSLKSDYIAVFDSGVGGVSVLRELIQLMPNERYLYFGDSANAPYGTKTTAEVRDLTLAAAEMLMNRGCKALVVACNTATAAAIADLRAIYPEKIIIGIEPALKVAAGIECRNAAFTAVIYVYVEAVGEEYHRSAAVFLFQQVGAELCLLATLGNVHAAAARLYNGKRKSVTAIEYVIRLTQFKVYVCYAVLA